MNLRGRGRYRSDREDAFEELGEDRQGEEPRPDRNQQPPAPPFDGRCLSLDPFDRSLFSARHRERRGENEADEDDRRSDERGERRPETADGECVPGQTGQDWTRSAKARQNVDEPEETESRRLMFPP